MTGADIVHFLVSFDGKIHSSGVKRRRGASLRGAAELLVSYLRENRLKPEDWQILLGYGHDEKETLTLQEI